MASLRLGLRSAGSLLSKSSAPAPARLSARFLSSSSRPAAGSIAIAAPARAGAQSQRQGFQWAAVAALAFGGATGVASSRRTVQCEAPELGRSTYTSAGSASPVSPSKPESIVNPYQLSFGAVCGICAGIFIKKGLKLIAFFLGGGFIFLQYLSSQRLVSVNWSKLSQRYNSALESSAGGPADPNVNGWNGSMGARIYHRFVDFVTANFQERASLLAGLALGLRIG